MLLVPYLTLGLIKVGDKGRESEDGDEGAEAAKRRPSNIITGPNGDVLHDKYGFFLTDTFHKTLGKSPEEVEQRNVKERERTSKWLRMLKKWDFVCKFRQTKLKRRIRKGIPNTIRSWAWFHISNSQKYREKYPDLSKLRVDNIPMKVKEDVRTPTLRLVSMIVHP